MNTKMTDNRFMTRSEFQCMLNLWSLPAKGGFVRDIQEMFEDPRPAYTTTATFMKILARKGFCKVERVGSMQYYTPKVSKEEYCQRVMEKALEDYFHGNVVDFIGFLLNRNELTPEEKAAIVAMLK
jgi:predicted transcriptional regulator